MGGTGRRAPRQLTFAVLAAGVLAFALLQSLVIPVLPTIQEELGATQADVTWVLGLAARNRFRVQELAGPARLVVDVEHGRP